MKDKETEREAINWRNVKPGFRAYLTDEAMELIKRRELISKTEKALNANLLPRGEIVEFSVRKHYAIIQFPFSHDSNIFYQIEVCLVDIEKVEDPWVI